MIVRVWAWGVAVLAAISLIAFFADRTHQSAYRHDRAQTEVRARFYAAAVGRGSLNEPMSARKLAADLRGQDLVSFRADPNRYPGVSDELGVRVFQDCEGDCGAFTPEQRERIERARGGGLSAVVAADAPKKPPHPERWAYAALFLWLVGGAILLVVLSLLPILRQREKERALRRAYPSEYRLLDRIDRVLEIPTISLRERTLLTTQRANIQRSLIERMVATSPEAGAQYQVEQLIEEARLTLDAVEAGNRMIDVPSEMTNGTKGRLK